MFKWDNISACLIIWTTYLLPLFYLYLYNEFFFHMPSLLFLLRVYFRLASNITNYQGIWIFQDIKARDAYNIDTVPIVRYRRIRILNGIAHRRTSVLDAANPSTGDTIFNIIWSLHAVNCHALTVRIVNSARNTRRTCEPTYAGNILIRKFTLSMFLH